MPNKHHAKIGIIGGTGMYDSNFFKYSKRVKVDTPYGETSDLVSLGDCFGTPIAFIPRHGRKHTIPPHKINSRANIWALKELGVTRILSPSVVGSLRKELRPGDIVVSDQFIDFTRQRDYTYYDNGQICHISMADPFCPELRQIAIQRIKNLLNYDVHSKGTYLCVEGPRFSTRAESLFFKDVLSADVIGMTLVPECVLAREAQLCYVSIAMITDYDVWSDSPVSTKAVLEILKMNVERTKKIVTDLASNIPPKRNICDCSRALDGALI
ncbi:MAG TPA: S-methyl-5'-thioadenosine phosphorylase [Nitrososphaeraceae archaeon]|nr:S-methyl-5'-thioadenosine phosphorylase [Nitrososphaeraceae archaeon]